MNRELINKVKSRFREHFKEEPQLFRSPGRVNLIGEHTDYNNGFVLPGAIDKAIYIAITPRKDDRIILYSEDFNEHHETSVKEVKPTPMGWPNYVLGVVDQLNKRGFTIRGFNLSLDGDVPIGAGLSSSAAVECATAFALNTLFELDIPKLELALIAQKAEHVFARVMCGIMDQFASVFGKKDHVIKLDCQSLQYEYVPLDLKGYKILLLNTNVRHSLASSEYNTRRQECEEGVALVKKHVPDVQSLRDVSVGMLRQFVEPVNQLVYRRCKYVVEEKQRLLETCDRLQKGDIRTLGTNMFKTHEGLSKDYEVSCPELDFLVDEVKNNPDVIGARMMGGGFGGCTINIIKEEAINQTVERVAAAYSRSMHKELTSYVVALEDGSGQVKL